MNTFATGSSDGKINLYNLWSLKYLRSFRHPRN